MNYMKESAFRWRTWSHFALPTQREWVRMDLYFRRNRLEEKTKQQTERINYMKVMKKYSMNFPAVEYTGPTNRCRCGKMGRYLRTPCGGYALGCECGAQTDIHVPNLTKQNANLLREEWNSLIINSELSPEFVKIYNLDNGDLIFSGQPIVACTRVMITSTMHCPCWKKKAAKTLRLIMIWRSWLEFQMETISSHTSQRARPWLMSRVGRASNMNWWCQ